MRAVALALGLTLCAAAPAWAEEDPDARAARWVDLKHAVFGDREVTDGTGVISLDAPARALDAALVPVSVSLSAGGGAGAGKVKAVWLLVDGNPSPLAGTFKFGPAADPRSLKTRVRVDQYTLVHAVAETEDGHLFASERYVKAAGGCSAPALKQVASAVPLGTMRFRELPPNADTGGEGQASAEGAKPGEREAQIMIRHPNFSGLQMDQVSRLYIPADFVKSLQLWQGKEMLVSIEGGNSIAENPEFRFRFTPNGDERFRAEAVDSTDQQFQGEWKAATAS